jgi:uncharacterized Zn-finger protein
MRFSIFLFFYFSSFQFSLFIFHYLLMSLLQQSLRFGKCSSRGRFLTPLSKNIWSKKENDFMFQPFPTQKNTVEFDKLTEPASPVLYFYLYLPLFFLFLLLKYTHGKHRSNAENLISKVPVILVDGYEAVCDGGGSGALGHPLEYIQLRTSSGEPQICKYCGLRYKFSGKNAALH